MSNPTMEFNLTVINGIIHNQVKTLKTLNFKFEIKLHT
jgi:hypothetical protein